MTHLGRIKMLGQQNILQNDLLELYIQPATDLMLQQSADSSSEIQTPEQIIRQLVIQTHQLFEDHRPLHQSCHSQFLTQICMTLFQKFISLSDSCRSACIGECIYNRTLNLYFCHHKNMLNYVCLPILCFFCCFFIVFTD